MSGEILGGTMNFDEVAERVLAAMFGGVPNAEHVEYLGDVLEASYKEGIRESERVAKMMDAEDPVPPGAEEPEDKRVMDIETKEIINTASIPDQLLGKNKYETPDQRSAKSATGVPKGYMLTPDGDMVPDYERSR